MQTSRQNKGSLFTWCTFFRDGERCFLLSFHMVKVTWPYNWPIISFTKYIFIILFFFTAEGDSRHQHLLAQSHRWTYQINVWNLLKVNNKDTRLMSFTSFWCPYCQFQTHFIFYSSVFSASIADFEQIKSWIGSRAIVPKKKYSSFIAHEKRLIYCSQWRPQNLWHI